MSQSVEEVSELQAYLRGVLNRADHHADNVNEVVLTLVGAILRRKDPEPIRVMTKQGQTGNVLWVNMSGRKYAFSYSHASGKVEMREGSLQGAVAHTFSNADSPADVKKIFAAL